MIKTIIISILTASDFAFVLYAKYYLEDYNSHKIELQFWLISTNVFSLIVASEPIIYKTAINELQEFRLFRRICFKRKQVLP